MSANTHAAPRSAATPNTGSAATATTSAVANPGRVRPVYRNINVADLTHYRLPLPGIVSILHRVSGALMFLALPLVLWALDASLASQTSFNALHAAATSPLARIFWCVLVWALLHHLCAGVRYLLLDLHVGVDKVRARRGALVVFVVSVPLAAVCALKIFGAF